MADVYKQSFKQNYTNNIELSIFNCGLERCAPGQTWGPGTRDHYLIHLVVSGKGVFEVGGRTYEVTPGDLFFARPSQLIRYTADETQPWEYSWVGFNGACAHKLAAQLPFTDTAPVHHTQDLEGMRAALSSISSSRGLQPQDEAAMVGYLYLFISALMRETSESRPHSTSSSSQYVLNAIKYIQFNYSHDISIDDVAKSGSVSRSHLYRVFMLNVGKSPIDYLTEYRVNEACKLLRGGTLSIAEVAASVGFLDQFYFSRVFKRAKGVPPSKYMTSQADAAVQPAPDETLGEIHPCPYKKISFSHCASSAFPTTAAAWPIRRRARPSLSRALPPATRRRCASSRTTAGTPSAFWTSCSPPRRTASQWTAR